MAQRARVLIAVSVVAVAILLATCAPKAPLTAGQLDVDVWDSGLDVSRPAASDAHDPEAEAAPAAGNADDTGQPPQDGADNVEINNDIKQHELISDSEAQTAPLPPAVALDAKGITATELGGVPTSTCAIAPPALSTPTMMQGWPVCFEKPWPDTFYLLPDSKSKIAPKIWGLPNQKLLVGSEDEQFPWLTHWLRIVGPNLQPICQLTFPYDMLKVAKGSKVVVWFVTVTSDRFFVVYGKQGLPDNDVVVEYGLDCTPQLVRTGRVEDMCGDCPGYKEPGAVFSTTEEAGKLSLAAFGRKGEVLWKSAIPGGLPFSATTFASNVAVKRIDNTYWVLDHAGQLAQVLPASVVDSRSFTSLKAGSYWSHALAHHDACGENDWSWEVAGCGNGLVACVKPDSYFPVQFWGSLEGMDAFGLRLHLFRTDDNYHPHAVASVSTHGRRTPWLETAYAGLRPHGAHFFSDGGYVAWNFKGLIRANRLGSTTCKGCGPPAPDCSDSDPCTKDSCDPSLGDCVHEPIAGCAKPKGACFTTDDCDDANPCTTDTCDKPSGACSYAANAVENCKTGVWKTDAELAGWVNPPDWYPSDGWLSPVKSVRPQLHEAPDGGLIVVDEWDVRRYMQKGKQRYTRALPEPAGASALAPDAGVVLYVRQPEGKEVAGKSRFLRLKPTGQIAQDATIESGLVDWILPDTWMERKRWLLAKPGGGGYQFVGRKTWTGDTWHARVIHLSEALTATETVEIALPGIVGGDVPQTRGIEAVWAGKDGGLLVGWRKKGAKGPEYGAAACSVGGKLLWSKVLLDGNITVDAGFDPWRPHAYAFDDNDNSAVVTMGPGGVNLVKVAASWYGGQQIQGLKGGARHSSFAMLPGGLAFFASFMAVPGKPPSQNYWKASLPPSPQWLVVAEQAKKKLVEFNKLCEKIENESGPCSGGEIGCCSMNYVPFKCNEPIATILARDGHAILDVHVLSTGWTALLVGSSPAYPNYGAVVMLDKDFRFASSGATFPAWWLNWTAGGKFMSGCHPTKGSTWDVCCAQSD